MVIDVRRLKEKWNRFQFGPSGPDPAKDIEFPTPRSIEEAGFKKRHKMRIENLRDEMTKLEGKLSYVASNPGDREKRKECDVVIERLVKIKYEIGIRVKLLER